MFAEEWIIGDIIVNEKISPRGGENIEIVTIARLIYGEEFVLCAVLHSSSINFIFLGIHYLKKRYQFHP